MKVKKVLDEPCKCGGTFTHTENELGKPFYACDLCAKIFRGDTVFTEAVCKQVAEECDIPGPALHETVPLADIDPKVLWQRLRLSVEKISGRLDALEKMDHISDRQIEAFAEADRELADQIKNLENLLSDRIALELNRAVERLNEHGGLIIDLKSKTGKRFEKLEKVVGEKLLQHDMLEFEERLNAQAVVISDLKSLTGRQGETFTQVFKRLDELVDRVTDKELEPKKVLYWVNEEREWVEIDATDLMKNDVYRMTMGEDPQIFDPE